MKEQYFEVLAPAGGPEPLRAAVYAGADAVYLGGPAFGARANAQNFSREQLAEAVGFCHARGVRVHVTVNTLLKEKELPPGVGICGIFMHPAGGCRAGAGHGAVLFAAAAGAPATPARFHPDEPSHPGGGEAAVGLGGGAGRALPGDVPGGD